MDDVLTRPRRLGAPMFPDRWDNEKTLHIGIWIGQGWSPRRIAAELMDGTSEASIRSRLQKIGYHSLNDDQTVTISFNATVQQRALIQARADQEGLSIGEFIRQFITCGARRRSTFREIVGKDQFL